MDYELLICDEWLAGQYYAQPSDFVRGYGALGSMELVSSGRQLGNLRRLSAFFSTKWISENGLTLLMASSGSFDDYNLTLQKVVLQLREQKQ